MAVIAILCQIFGREITTNYQSVSSKKKCVDIVSGGSDQVFIDKAMKLLLELTQEEGLDLGSYDGQCVIISAKTYFDLVWIEI